MLTLCKRAFPVLSLAAILLSNVQGQTTQGGIVGTVHEQKGANVPDVNLTVTNPSTGLQRQTKTADNGVFRVMALPTGVYQIRAEAPGFATTTTNGVEIGVDQIRDMDIKFLSGKEKNADIDDLKKDDVVIIPAFGTEIAVMEKLKARGCQFVDTTCGDVMSVWKRVRQYANDSVTSIIHGKSWHEETKATSSRATASGRGHYLVVFTLAETDYVCDYIINGGSKTEFLEKFKGAFSPGFDPDIHLKAIGVANQTTMLRGETEEVQRRLRAAMEKKYGSAELEKHFRFFDTICGATQDRQDALEKLLAQPLDLLLVVGGYNSSNTSHLAEMGEAKLPTYFIKNAAKMVSDKLIQHYNQHQHKEVETREWLPPGQITVGITAGASCPNNLIEDAIRRLFELRGISVQELLAAN